MDMNELADNIWNLFEKAVLSGTSWEQSWSRMSYSEKELGSTIVDFEGGDEEFAATHTVANAAHGVNPSHVAQSQNRERTHSGALHSTSFLCYDLKSISPGLQVTNSSMILLFFHLQLQQNHSLVTSLCMQLNFSE